MTERLSSGSTRLDAVLGGGLPTNAINLIIGPPGSGKTILAEQYLFCNATDERPGLFLSTVSEPFDKVLRYGESLAFFDADAIGRRVFYDDLGAALMAHGIEGLVDQIDGLLKEIRPGTIVIDSFKAIRAFASDEAAFRRFLHDLAGRLTAVTANTFWIGEYEREATTDAAEFAVADSILAMDTKRTAERETRVLQILKLRGSGFMSGEHAYRITASGISVFPRLADVQDTAAYEFGTERDSTGIAALDDALGDGYWEGSSTLIAGPTGRGQDAARTPLCVQRRRRRPACDPGDVPGELDPARTNRVRIRLVVRRPVHLGAEPIAGRSLHRRMGLRPARPHRGDQGHSAWSSTVSAICCSPLPIRFVSASCCIHSCSAAPVSG